MLSIQCLLCELASFGIVIKTSFCDLKLAYFWLVKLVLLFRTILNYPVINIHRMKVLVVIAYKNVMKYYSIRYIFTGSHFISTFGGLLSMCKPHVRNLYQLWNACLSRELEENIVLGFPTFLSYWQCKVQDLLNNTFCSHRNLKYLRCVVLINALDSDFKSFAGPATISIW
jgi:hypothetical protein